MAGGHVSQSVVTVHRRDRALPGTTFGAKSDFASMSIGPVEVLLIALVVLLLFGAGRLPEIGRSMGAGLRDFKRALDGGHPRRDARDEPRTPEDHQGR